MHRPANIRFLIANAGHARWVTRNDNGFVTLSETRPRHLRQAPHPSGSVHESASSERHGAGEIDLSAQRRADFAHELAGEINTYAADGGADRLAIVAPAKMLSALRPRLSRAASARIVREIGKDLTKVPNHRLQDWLVGPDLA